MCASSDATIWFEEAVDHDQALLSKHPVRVRVTIRYDGDEVALTLDEELTVLDVSGDG